jgi:hypothetical protein
LQINELFTLVGAARFELTTPAPKAGDLLSFPSIESGIYGTCPIGSCGIDQLQFSLHCAPPLAPIGAPTVAVEGGERVEELNSAPALRAEGRKSLQLGLGALLSRSCSSLPRSTFFESYADTSLRILTLRD